MNRQRGMSSLALVLLILLLGSLLLNGLNQQRVTHIQRVTTESLSLQHYASVQSALEWGRMQQWDAKPAVQCLEQRGTSLRVCLRILEENRVLLIAGSAEQRLWRGGRIEKNKVLFSAHGWSDFCPLKETALCELP
ncbi:DUF2509 family protein [Yokenella regensburgei]|uniref:DUF2509 family protein n=1 Tax=Yokenella regensburgei TaxID=158877 RepID=UPI003F143232